MNTPPTALELSKAACEVAHACAAVAYASKAAAKYAADVAAKYAVEAAAQYERAKAGK